jgi:methylamine dehydrogenase heavy chain
MLGKLIFLVWVLSVPVLGAAQIKPEGLPDSEVLPAEPNPHWVWVNDIVFHHMADGKAYLVDGDTGRFLGMLNTGVSFAELELPSDYSQIYSPETYFSRGSRGERTDVITFYDPMELKPTGEVIIPAKRFSGIPTPNLSAITDNNRFLVVYNFTPAQSVSIIDLEKRRLVGETATAGCALVLPSGDKRFLMMCGDGSLMTVTLNDSGEVTNKQRNKPFFDPKADPVTEKAVRWKDSWIFVSFRGDVYPVDVSAEQPVAGKHWSLFSEAERNESWRPGGIQHLAVHEASGRLYALVHKGGEDTHKDPGQDVWVYDLNTQKQIQKIKLDKLSTAIQISKDDAPLMFSIFIGNSTLDIYDAFSGKLLRSVDEIGFTPTLLQTP